MKKFKQIISRNQKLLESDIADSYGSRIAKQRDDYAAELEHARKYHEWYTNLHPDVKEVIAQKFPHYEKSIPQRIADYSQEIDDLDKQANWWKNLDSNVKESVETDDNSVVTVTMPKDSAKLISHALVRHYDTIWNMDQNHPSLDKLSAVIRQLDGTKDSKTTVKEENNDDDIPPLDEIQKKLDSIPSTEGSYAHNVKRQIMLMATPRGIDVADHLYRHLIWYNGLRGEFQDRINDLHKKSAWHAEQLAHGLHAEDIFDTSKDLRRTEDRHATFAPKWQTAAKRRKMEKAQAASRETPSPVKESMVNEWFGYPSDPYVAHIQKKKQSAGDNTAEVEDLDNHLTWYNGLPDIHKVRILNLFKTSPGIAAMFAHGLQTGQSDANEVK